MTNIEDRRYRVNGESNRCRIWRQWIKSRPEEELVVKRFTTRAKEFLTGWKRGIYQNTRVADRCRSLQISKHCYRVEQFLRRLRWLHGNYVLLLASPAACATRSHMTAALFNTATYCTGHPVQTGCLSFNPPCRDEILSQDLLHRELNPYFLYTLVNMRQSGWQLNQLSYPERIVVLSSLTYWYTFYHTVFTLLAGEDDKLNGGRN